MLRSDYKPKNDFSPQAAASVGRRPLVMVTLLALIGLSIIFSAILFRPAKSHTLADNDKIETPTTAPMVRKTLALELPEEQSSVGEEAFGNRRTVEVIIKPGDTLADVFKANGIPAATLQRIIRSGKVGKSLATIYPGQKLILVFSGNGRLLSLQTWQTPVKRLDIDLSGPEVRAQHVEKVIQTETAFAAGVIENSFYLAGKKAGLTDALIMEMAGIFGWDIDFVLDIRKGDRFQVVYEKRYVDGQFFENGPILAAEFVNQGQVYRAVRYVDSQGNAAYYTPEGLNMRKTFLRAPLNFMYISSGFKPRRFHPILKRVRPHRGIDYRAPKGTPVWAAGDGRVVKAGYNKYNGNYVFIKHGERYMTKYLHFSKLAVKTGQYVKQGQVIGYVGATGLAEAPHLHYEFLVDGVHRNPRTVKLPQAKPINPKEKARFLKQTQPLIAQLELQSRLQWAHQP
ncbi:MAG: peptidase M23 [Gammaproteobacteria bacterium]|nr:MAG: peptidase M23 [Gammaproteobacteria bacterium]